MVGGGAKIMGLIFNEIRITGKKDRKDGAYADWK